MKFYTGIYNFKLQKALFTMTRCIVMPTEFFFDIEQDGELSFNTESGATIVFNGNFNQLTLKSIAQTFENYFDKFKSEEDEFYWNDYARIKEPSFLDKSTHKILSMSCPEDSIPYKWLFIAVDKMKGLTAKELVQKYTKEEAFNDAMRKFKEALEQQRDKLQKRIEEIAAKM